jgi:hypothetical protein
MHDYHDITSKRILENTRPQPTDAELAEAAARVRGALVVP